MSKLTRLADFILFEKKLQRDETDSEKLIKAFTVSLFGLGLGLPQSGWI